uniref:Uncharacterized protein n=1 Tax=Aegilops tauschii subsp. strangulata TaxID=200361 RepID=A0A453C946_AEGTS
FENATRLPNFPISRPHSIAQPPPRCPLLPFLLPPRANSSPAAPTAGERESAKKAKRRREDDRGRGVMASRTASKDIITLKGSAAIVSEFFGTRAPPPDPPLPILPSPVSDRMIRWQVTRPTGARRAGKQ